MIPDTQARIPKGAPPYTGPSSEVLVLASSLCLAL